MLNVTWLSTPEEESEEAPPKILGCRRAEHSDITRLERLISTKTREIFGDVEPGRIYELSCLSIVQYNEKQDVISGACLCNFPNVPTVPPDDWLAWFKTLYGIENVTARNTLFAHFLVWEERYVGRFFESLLTGVFDVAADCQHVILVFPPQVTPGDVFERQMVKVPPKGIRDTESVQTIYVSVRHLKNPRLKIRRVVEEDNDDVIPIIDGESGRLKEHYGEYYVSEMTRYPDDHRQLIVSEDTDGLATGVMCLNSTLDVDILNENFELGPYNGLREPHEDDEIPLEDIKPTSEIFLSIFSRILGEKNFSEHRESKFLGNVCRGSTISKREESRGEIGEPTTNAESKTIENARVVESSAKENSSSSTSSNSSDPIESKRESEEKTRNRDATENSRARSSSATSEKRKTKETKETKDEVFDAVDVESLKEKSLDESKVSFLDDLPSISEYFDMYCRSKIRSSVFADSLFDYPRTSSAPAAKISETLPFEETQDVLPRPIYHGETNAFVVEIFATRKEIENRWLRNYLEAAFDCFPDLDYCAILLPFSHPFFPFLEHFVRVPLRCNKDFPMSLYVTHRAVHLGEMRSRRGELQDRGHLENLLRGIPKREKVLDDFDLAMRDHQSDLQCYILECELTIVGSAIVCAEERFDYLKRRYHVENYISVPNIPRDNYGRILHFVLMPVFLVHQGFFHREIMRLSGLTVLNYRLYESDVSALTRSAPLPVCLDSMMPVDPRKRIAYTFRGYVETDVSANEDEEIFSLFMTTPRLTMISNSIVDTKIVIIGASDCGVAFAECLALGSRQNFVHLANLTIVSPNGLPFERKYCGVESRMIPFRGRFCYEHRRLVALRAWTNVVYGRVVSVNRKEKYVTVMNQGNLTYDYLILTCGLQYQKPTFEDEARERMRGEPIEREVPWNCLTINDDTEASSSLEKVRLLTDDLQDRKAIIFYGHNVNCYCALEGLLEFGLEGSWITLIEPPLDPGETHDSIFYNDCEVDTEVINGIIRNGVHVLHGWNVVNWFTRETEKGRMIESVTLETNGETKTIPCDAFFNFSEKTIDVDIFFAICRAGLVFDGQLVIDPECRTNDPFIFAAGTITKYSRKFYSASWQHKYYSSVEVGERLAKILRKVIDVYQEEEEAPFSSSRDKPYLTLPIFRTPITVACVLPGGYHYLHIRKPGKSVSRKVAIERGFYGQVMITGSCRSEIGYFRIRLNPHDSVETITCFCKKSFEVNHTVSLYGKHESMLNELKTRFSNSLISDFYAYFREPWATAMFYDKFECLRMENRATLLSRVAADDNSLIDDCVRALLKSKWESISEEDRRLIQAKYAGSIYHQELEENLLEFLQLFEDDLPVYVTPRKLRELYADIDKSPLFQEL